MGFLTNIYTGGVLDPAAEGRGFLVVDWLRGDQGAEQYLQALAENNKTYNPFNLVLLEVVGGSYQVWR